ncbi:pyridoxamine 5'-phosphate oxidase family protein [Pseudoalteromonas sp. MMG012]|uniref:pyridoxamine 5'-phosphate oxidase family protein n=1 Tax=Pseudoalteromonas sp. MMG012 TaxID=2822686 RepID=UPI001B39DFC7|nr:pyridoxamine 5'-phosphate oxidase family protein [Pseudoalteromonas sp. MMG012]MBQ4850088.1 pyridoxamine 5'-phosphate oxidase family protein [Pseudoalteromonas sp. MMG012]
MLTEAVKASINESVLCWLATVDIDGVPNNSPKEVFLAHGNTAILIADIASPNSVKNIQGNANVCVSFVHVLKQKGFKLTGTATYHRKSTAGFDELFTHIYPITGEQYPVKGIIYIEITTVKPIVAPSYYLQPDLTEQQQIASARKVYGV